MEILTLTPLRILAIIVAIASLVAAFRHFVWNSPPSKRSDRILLFLRESIGSICVVMVGAYQWKAFTGWRLAVTLMSFAVGIGVVSDILKFLLKPNVKEDPVNS